MVSVLLCIRSWDFWFDRPVVQMYKKIFNCSLADKCLECCKLASLFNSSNNFSKTCLFSPNTALNPSPCPSSSSWTRQQSLESLRGVLTYRPDSEWMTAPAAMQVTEPITCIRRRLCLIEFCFLLCKTVIFKHRVIWENLLTVFSNILQQRCIR